MQKTLYFDMDGVLVKYDRAMYIGKQPLFLQPNVHCFRHLPPDLKMIQVLYELSVIHQIQSYIITSVPHQNDLLFNEHFHDKILWDQTYCPWLKINQIFISVTNKQDIAKFIKGNHLTKNDILIDDFNKNLIEWENANGTAIKYCNGINTPNTFHRRLEEAMSAKEIVDYILTI